MAKLSTDELLDAFKEMTLLELSEFVKQFEDTFDVKAAAPVAVAAPVAGGAGAEAPAAEEKDEFNVTLEAAGDKKIQVIKEVRTLTSLGLKEAKDLVDGAPKLVLENVNKEAGGQGQGSPRGCRRHGHRQVSPTASRRGAAPAASAWPAPRSAFAPSAARAPAARAPRARRPAPPPCRPQRRAPAGPPSTLPKAAMAPP